MKNKYKPGWRWNKSISEIAVELGCSVRTIQRGVKSGNIPYRPVGGRRRFCVDEVWDWIGRNKLSIDPRDEN